MSWRAQWVYDNAYARPLASDFRTPGRIIPEKRVWNLSKFRVEPRSLRCLADSLSGDPANCRPRDFFSSCDHVTRPVLAHNRATYPRRSPLGPFARAKLKEPTNSMSTTRGASPAVPQPIQLNTNAGPSGCTQGDYGLATFWTHNFLQLKGLNR